MDLYTTAEEAKSVKGFIEGLQILAKYMPKGMDTKFFLGAEHDILYLGISTEDIGPKSEEGKRLSALGFHIDSDLGDWAFFT